MKYLIPSYKRAGSVTTISYLRGIGIAPECIYVSTQTTEDRDKYQQLYGDDCTVVYREAHNCAGNRNTLVGLLEDGEEGLLLDDDMYWELLEEQHAHDVVMVGAEGSEEDERPDRESGCD